MALRDAAQRVSRERDYLPCTIQIIMSGLNDEERALLAEWIAADPRKITGEWIAKVLREEGYKVKGNTVNRHRRGGCSCSES